MFDMLDLFSFPFSRCRHDINSENGRLSSHSKLKIMIFYVGLIFLCLKKSLSTKLLLIVVVCVDVKAHYLFVCLFTLKIINGLLSSFSTP